jgi:hypothetical protein
MAWEDPPVRAYRGFVLMATALGLADDASAQFRVLPPAPAVAPRDVFFHPRRGRVVVSGFFGDGFFGPPVVFAPPPGFVYGVIEPRFSVHVYVPPRFLAPAVDLSGVDLDAEPPPWVREGELPRRGVPAVVQPRQQPEQVAKIEPPKKEVAPPVVPPVVPPVLAPEKPKLPGQAAEANLVLGSRQLTALGVAAFQDKDYGVAAQRFQQALDADAAAARPHFLLGQAYVALGKFREAVQIIGVGLAKDPTWPRSDFRPRVDLYMNQDDWNRHVALLEQVQAGQPQNAGYLFLLAYVRWFDDDRAAATRLFREVRPLVGDPGLVDLFLKKS